MNDLPPTSERQRVPATPPATEYRTIPPNILYSVMSLDLSKLSEARATVA